jgi:glycosyltransferase involved in cell wall biosynthesis
MLFYVLPGTGIHGGVKKGFHCADMLSAAGHPCAAATPDGARPDWFASACEVVARDELRRDCRAEDVVLFSCPADAPLVDALPARRKIVHMQGANTPADHALLDRRRGYELISHSLHMTYEVQRHGRVAPYVPIGIPDAFRWAGEAKSSLRIAAMPRKGAAVLDKVRRVLPRGSELRCLDGLPERAVAEELKRADIFLAISSSEAFGLPPLEAMCAGCCVVGFPGEGGFEFMRHGETAHVVPNGDVEALVVALHHVCAAPAYRDALRGRAAAVAAYYTMERERAYLLRALGFPGAP